MKRIGLLSALLLGFAVFANEPGKADKGPQAWTYDQAMSQLKLYPKDSYLQFVVLQLARRENKVDQACAEIDQFTGNSSRRQANERASDVDLFSIFSGALAIQESLQLDTMRGGKAARPAPMTKGQPVPVTKGQPAPTGPESAPNRAQKENTNKSSVAITSLTGPTIKSHPWQQMLAGKKPVISPLAHCVPEDFYYAEFRSLSKMLEALDLSGGWGSHMFSQATQEARTQLVSQRLQKQLAVETQPVLRRFYDLVVEQAGVTGSDLFVREGSDVTLLFRFKQPAVFKARMNGFLDNALKSSPEARRTEGTILGVPYVSVSTPDRTVHVFSAYPEENLHVRSNSLAGLTRVLEAIQGKNFAGKPVRRLGDTDELAYIRTLMPAGAAEEDGFVYLSDPFIRRVVGPQLKLTEAHRMICFNHLRMIGNAALLYRTEHGKAPSSLEELAKANCTPGVFGQGELACPDGGSYALSSDGLTGQCSHHGHADCLVPCLEIPLTQVSGDEAAQYKAFLDDYNQYWRMYFDPIAIRLQVTPGRLRLETIILPLIDNSIYTNLAMALGGKPEPLDALPVPKRNIFSVALRLRKDELLEQAGIGPTVVSEPKEGNSPQFNLALQSQCLNNLKQIGLALHNYHDSFSSFPAVANFNKEGKPLLSWRVHLLPFLDQQDLYKEFHLDEPWDSEHNKKLIARIPSPFHCPSSKAAAGLTTYLAPVGKDTMFTGADKKLRLADVTDGTSNTIFVVEADDEHAVPWTKPADLPYDAAAPWKGLVGQHGLICDMLFVDGSVHGISKNMPADRLKTYFTRSGGEVDTGLQIADEPQQQRPGMMFDMLGAAGGKLDQVRYQEFLSKGIGNQIGLHVYDAVPFVDLNFPSFLGMAVGTFNGRRGMVGGEEGLWIGFVGASLTAPVYISVPVRDPKIVDSFLEQLDPLIAELSRQRESGGFLPFRSDYYKTTSPGGVPVRTTALHIGPITWRLFWARIGNGLYLSNKLFVFDDIKEAPLTKPGADQGPVAHAMLRLRPQNWNQVLPDYRIGWAENDREACLNNVGPISSLARALAATNPALEGKKFDESLHELAHKIYGVDFYCPSDGKYVLAADHKSVTCSVHGTAIAPTQPQAQTSAAPHESLKDFAGLTMGLTFLEDGLHATVTIDRK